MNPRHERFAAGLAAGMTGKDAAIAAGFAPRSAKVRAARLRHDPCIQAEVLRIKRDEPLPLHRRPNHDLDPLAFVLSVVSDRTESLPIRMRAAVIALRHTRRPL